MKARGIATRFRGETLWRERRRKSPKGVRCAPKMKPRDNLYFRKEPHHNEKKDKKFEALVELEGDDLITSLTEEHTHCHVKETLQVRTTHLLNIWGGSTSSSPEERVSLIKK